MTDRTPVYSLWQPDVGPALSLGMLLASTRIYKEGRLNKSFELRPMELVDEFLEDLADRQGPAILLASDYVWSTDFNLKAAELGREINPDLFVIHGGPNAPKYPADAERFLRENRDLAHILVRGEGEHALPEILEALDETALTLSPERFSRIDGITFLDSADNVYRTEDRERTATLEDLPSPYLSGEFDHLDPDMFIHRTIFLETNRGCPYGCVFCDWGSQTLSRVRKFSPDRVRAECEWAQERGFDAIFLCDANFGILPQDIEIAEVFSDLRERTGFPSGIGMSLAKKATKRVLRVVEKLMSSGIVVSSTVSLQSVDPETLEASHRDNIPLDTYLDVAAMLRRRGYGLQGDLILGLPGQTYEAFKSDIQFMFGHEIVTRIWPLRVLTNSPLNDPDFRAEHSIVADEDGLIKSTACMGEDVIGRAMRLRTIDGIAERYGLFRHILRFLQWDHGLRAIDVEDALLEMTLTRPADYPTLSWTLTHFDVFTTPAAGRNALFNEVERFIIDELGVPDGEDLQTVLLVQKELTPAAGRSFPCSVDLVHDYVAYYLGATRSLYETGRAGVPERSLSDYGPGNLDIEADLFEVCKRGTFLGADLARPFGRARERIIEDDFHLGSSSTNELISPLTRVMPVMTGLGPTIMEQRLALMGLDAEALDRAASGEVLSENESPIPVSISPSSNH